MGTCKHQSDNWNYLPTAATLWKVLCRGKDKKLNSVLNLQRWQQNHRV